MSDSDQQTDVLEQTVGPLGFEIIHSHEDLIFVTPNRFILKKTGTPYMVDLYFNEKLDADAAEALMARIEKAGLENSLIIAYKGAYSITEHEEDSLSVEFFDLDDE